MTEIDIEKINRVNYRSCLTALSQPGKICSLLPLFDSGLQAMASLLLYSEVSYHYEGELDFRVVAALTGAKAQPIDSADYLFFDRPSVPVLQRAKTGTAENPESGASLLFRCNNLNAGNRVVLSGPGIDGSFATQLPADTEFIDCLQEINATFPTGLDLFFVDGENRIIGLPRTTRIEVQP